jgi:hypothetical protein
VSLARRKDNTNTGQKCRHKPTAHAGFEPITPVLGWAMKFRVFDRATTVIVEAELIYLVTHGAELFVRSRQLCSQSRTSQHFMEPEGSLPCSQKPYTDPHPEPYQSNPHHPIISL